MFLIKIRLQTYKMKLAFFGIKPHRIGKKNLTDLEKTDRFRKNQQLAII